MFSPVFNTELFSNIGYAIGKIARCNIGLPYGISLEYLFVVRKHFFDFEPSSRKINGCVPVVFSVDSYGQWF